MTGAPEHPATDGASGKPSAAEILAGEIRAEIHRLTRFSIRGVLALALFLLVSLLAWWNFPMLPQPDAVIAVLGKPPSSRMVSLVLVLYTFSAVILSLSRMTAGLEHRSSFSHVGFLTGFFLFYFYNRTLVDNYWAVLGAGMTILGVESYRIWTFCSENVAKMHEDLEYVTRTGQPPPE